MHDLVSFVQSKKREKYPWRSVAFIEVAGFLKANSANGTKSSKVSQINFSQIQNQYDDSSVPTGHVNENKWKLSKIDWPRAFGL